MRILFLFKILFFNLLIFIITLEILSLILIKIKVIPKDLPPVFALEAHKEFSYWHPLNKKIKISSSCWNSEIEFNSIGLKSSKEFKKKTKMRIAILGDSMTENIQLNNEKDFTSKLQYELPEYEIINFSVASTGLADQLDIYNKLIKNFDIDYLFLFVTENDFNDNYIKYKRPNRLGYDYFNQSIYEYPREDLYFKNYFSKYNIFKREKLLFMKDFSNTFKLYSHFKYYIYFEMQKNQLKETKEIPDDFSKKIEVYKFLKEKFLKDVNKKSNLLVFLNIDNKNFLQETAERKAIKNIWSPNNIHDPTKEAAIFLKALNKLKPPYMGFICDGHYSEMGVEYLSKYVAKIFKSK
jgi:hypothetical protein